MHLPTRSHIRILAGLSLSLAAAVASAGEDRSYQLVDIPQRALAAVDAYLIGRLSSEEQPAAQQPTGKQPTVQQTLTPEAIERSEPTQRAQSSDVAAKREADNRAVVLFLQSPPQPGETLAMGRLGAIFLQCIGVPQSYAEAIKWYTRAAEAGDAEAMNDLGTLYASGNGLRQDCAAAQRW